MNDTLWWEQPAVAFDTESTGVSVELDRIVTIALVHLGEGVPRPERYLVDPGVEIPAEATAIHGVTTEQARAEGVKPGPALESTAGALALAMSRGQAVIGMNLSFDLSLLHFECLRHGVETLSARLDGAVRPVVDVLVLDKAVDTYRRGSRKLDALCAQYGVTHHGAHDSAYDALASAMVAAKIAQAYAKVSELSLDELHDAQVQWAAQQRASLQQYFDRTRRADEARRVVETGWPLQDVCAAGVSS